MASLSNVSITWDDEDRPVITVQYQEPGGGDSDARPDEWLVALAERLTDKSATYLRALLDVNASKGHVSLADLATDLSVDKKDVDGWNRNLGRSIKAVVRDSGFLRPDEEDGTAQLFEVEWDKADEVWVYAVPEKYRATLIKALDER